MYDTKQIEEITKNKNVCRCSLKSITYSKDFKLKAIKQYYEDGYSPTMIFEEASFDLDVIGRDKPDDCLKRWKKIYNNKGEGALMEESRGGAGGRPKTKYKDDKEKIEYLETKIAYLDAENDFLAKLRGLKRK